MPNTNQIIFFHVCSFQEIIILIRKKTLVHITKFWKMSTFLRNSEPTVYKLYLRMRTSWNQSLFCMLHFSIHISSSWIILGVHDWSLIGNAMKCAKFTLRFCQMCLDCVFGSYPQSLVPNPISKSICGCITHIYDMRNCSFYAVPPFTLVSWATIYNHLMRTFKDYPIRTPASRIEKVVMNHKYCLFSQMLEFMRSRWMQQQNSWGPSCLCQKCLWTCLLGHTINLCCLWRPPPHLAPPQTERRAKMYRWINLIPHGILCASWMKWKLVHRAAHVGFSTHYLTKWPEL